jgi:hypothetical protein
MVQEFRYVAPGAVFMFFVALGLLIVSPSLRGNLGAFAGVTSALLTIPIGWILYQWLGYLTYLRGGLSAYHEVQVLKKLWEREVAGCLAVQFGGEDLLLDHQTLQTVLFQVGRRFIDKLRAVLPKEVKLPNELEVALGFLHDSLLFHEKSHDVARGMYGIHNTLTLIYWSILWGSFLLLVSFSIRNWPNFSAMTQHLILLVLLIILLFLRVMRRKSAGSWTALVWDHFTVLWVLLLLGVLGSTFGFVAYVAVVFGFLLHSIHNSFVPWKMLKTEAECREELLTWLYEQKTRVIANKKAATRNAPTTDQIYQLTTA